MPLGSFKTALMGAAGGGDSEYWFGLFDSNTDYYANSTGSQALDSSDNIGLAYQAYGSFDGILGDQYYAFNGIVDKEGSLTWSKALGPTSGGTVMYTKYPVSCVFKDTTNGKFVVSVHLPAGGEFGSLSPYYTSNSPWLYVDVNDATGAINADRVNYRALNNTVWLYGMVDKKIYTDSGTDYLFSAVRNGDGTGSDSSLGLMNQELASAGGFTGTPTSGQKYITGIGQNMYVGGYQPCAHGLDGSSVGRFAVNGYRYKNDDVYARFVPFVLMYDWDFGNFSQQSPYQSNTRSAFYHGSYVDASHNAYQVGNAQDPTTGKAKATLTKFNTSAVQQNFLAYESDGTDSNGFTHVAEDDSGNFYVGGYLNINHDSVDNVARATIVKFNSSLAPQWWRTIDVEPADASSSRYSVCNGVDINSDGNLVVSFLTGQNEYSVMGVAVLPTDGSGTGAYTIDGHTIDYFDSASTITDVSSNFSWSMQSPFSAIGVSLGSHENMTPDQRTGANIPGSVYTEGV